VAKFMAATPENFMFGKYLPGLISYVSRRGQVQGKEGDLLPCPRAAAYVTTSRFNSKIIKCVLISQNTAVLAKCYMEYLKY
jgi:hypothetical protein